MNSSQTLAKNIREGKTSQFILGVSYTIIAMLGKDINRKTKPTKLYTNTSYKYRLKNLNKVLMNQIYQSIKRIMYYETKWNWSELVNGMLLYHLKLNSSNISRQ